VIAIPLGTLAVLLLIVAALMVLRVFDFLRDLAAPHEHPAARPQPGANDPI
jgi:hypothetical protein